MTRQLRSVSPDRRFGNARPATPLRAAPGLTDMLLGELRGRIMAGDYAPGGRLPTEHALMQQMGVSRTVVREAVAMLRAEGLISTRQGSGAFVTAHPAARSFRVHDDGLGSIDDVLHLLELRLAVEQEAAALAAARAGARDRRSIAQALAVFERALGDGRDAISEDAAFHRAIARATANPRYIELLDLLGHHLIPRRSILLTDRTPGEMANYMKRLIREHRDVASAIEARDPEAARIAMRSHLDGAARRYSALRQPSKLRAKTSRSAANPIASTRKVTT